MIITLTLNPALDKTVYIDPLIPGGLNRVKDYEIDAGGKGLNVSKVVSMLGGKSIVTGFYGGANVPIFDAEIEKLGATNEFITVDGNTRTNLKVLDDVNGITEINEAGITVTKDEENAIIAKLLEISDENSIVVLAGSMHKNASPDFYEMLCNKLKEKGAKVFLDADNEAFANALKAKPALIKPNSDELLRFYGKESATTEELIEICRKMCEDGVETVVLSMGKDGAIFVTKDECYHAEGLKIKASSTVGAGDSMVGAFSFGTANKMSLRDTAILAIACSAGACTTKGTNPPSLELVEELSEKVIIHKIY